MISDDDNVTSKVAFNDEAIFRMFGTVDRHKCRIWAVQNPRASLEVQVDFPKVKVNGPFFAESTVTC